MGGMQATYTNFFINAASRAYNAKLVEWGSAGQQPADAILTQRRPCWAADDPGKTWQGRTG